MKDVGVDLQARFGTFELAVQLTAPGAGVTALFGRSGSGKTSLLRCLAGLERQARGTIRCGDEIWQSDQLFLPTHRRPIGYVFQEASLFPHLSVRGNLEYGWRRIPAHQRQVSLDEVVGWLGLNDLLQRSPQQLSGGQRQRVAIGRALLTSPSLLLMDEPLASLDLESKAEILPYLERLFAELRMPVLYVSHSPAEVMRLAQRLVLLEAGQVRASGDLNELLTRTDLPLAHLEEASAVIPARVERHDEHYHLTYLRTAAGELTVSRSHLPIGTQTRVGIRARDVSLVLEPPRATSISNVLPATVRQLSNDPDPAHQLVQLDLAGTPILARVTRRSADSLAIAPGLRLYVQVKSVALMA